MKHRLQVEEIFVGQCAGVSVNESLSARLISLSFTIVYSVENVLAVILPEGIKEFNQILAAF